MVENKFVLLSIHFLWIGGLFGAILALLYLQRYGRRHWWYTDDAVYVPQTVAPLYGTILLFCLGLALHAYATQTAITRWAALIWALLALLFGSRLWATASIGFQNGWDIPLQRRQDGGSHFGSQGGYPKGAVSLWSSSIVALLVVNLVLLGWSARGRVMTSPLNLTVSNQSSSQPPTSVAIAAAMTQRPIQDPVDARARSIVLTATNTGTSQNQGVALATASPTRTSIPATATPSATATATPTALPTATPSATPSATMTATPVPPTPIPPTRAPTRTPPARQRTATPVAPAAAKPVAGRANFTKATVVLLEPVVKDTLADKRPFRWQANFALPPGYAFEVVFWKHGQDPLRQGKGYAGLSTEAQVNASADSFHQRSAPEGEYQWGVLLVVKEPYQRVKYLGGDRVIYVKG